MNTVSFAVPALIRINTRRHDLRHEDDMDAHANSTVPLCPNCGKPMTFVRSVPRVGGLPELRSYECKACRVAYTAAGDERRTDWTAPRES